MNRKLFLSTGLLACVAGITAFGFLIFGHALAFQLLMSVCSILACLFIMLDPENSGIKTLKGLGIISMILISMALLIKMAC
jgi:hypothetical protein